MKDLKLRDKVRTLLYMIGMVAVLFMAETTIAYATIPIIYNKVLTLL